jgi:serine/threonine protein kinase
MDHLARVKHLFLECVVLPRPEQLAHLNRQCLNDPATHQSVSALLAAHASAGSFLEPHAPADAPGAEPEGSRCGAELSEVGPGSRIGPYTLRERLGGGGMGVVWAAQQREPVARLVALKLIKPGSATPELVSRFHLERQALAVMDHPNIARILDTGDTANGTPYLVMELVCGTAITHYCDAHHLTLRERLRLFAEVCLAIQHIHQKGVIHRDIKPANVLVAQIDGRAVPKVIDFGIAKPTLALVPGQPAATAFGLIGSPDYMSPEQTEGARVTTDTRSDVYSLGALLYELLTGLTPLGRARAEGEDLAETLRRIREDAPPPPSSHFALPESTGAAAVRSAPPHKLRRALRGELDWVVLRALEKDPGRRYATANDLAADVLRYLNDEPVNARPPGRVYLLRKFVRRNRVPVVAAALILLSLVGGVLGTTTGLVWALTARNEAFEARNNEAVQRGRAEASARDAQDALASAKIAEQAARDAQADTATELRFVGDRIVAAPRPPGFDGGLGRNVTVRDAIDRAATDLDRDPEIAAHPLVEASLREWLARVYRSLDEPGRAVEHQRRALALLEKHRGPDHADTLGARQGLAVALLANKQPDKAVAILEVVVPAARTRFGASDDRTLSAVNGLAGAYVETDRRKDAVTLYEEMVRTLEARNRPDDPLLLPALNNLAQSYFILGQNDKAVGALEQLVPRLRAAYGPNGNQTLTAMHTLAVAYRKTGRPAGAVPLLRHVVEVRRGESGPSHSATLAALDHLVLVCAESGRRDEAEKALDELLGAKPATGNPFLGHADLMKADLRARLGDYSAAEPLLRDYLVQAEKRAPDSGPVAVARFTLGWVLLAQQKPEDAEPLLWKGINGIWQHRGAIPPPFRDRILDIRTRLAAQYERAGRPDLSGPWKGPFTEPAQKAPAQTKRPAPAPGQ